MGELRRRRWPGGRTRWRVTAAATATAAAVLGVALLLGYQAFVDQQRSAAVNDGLGELGRLRDALVAGTTPSQEAGVPYPFQLVTDTGEVVVSSPVLDGTTGTAVVVPAPPPGAMNSTAASGLLIGNDDLVVPADAGGQLAGLTLPLMYVDLPRAQVAGAPDAASTVRVAVLVTPFATDALLAAIRVPLLMAVPVVLIVLAAVVWWSVGRALRPVAAIRRAMDTITAAGSGTRVARPATGDEVEDLAVSVNTTLDRLAAVDRQQRAFVSDAAHELRSPVAALRSTLDVARLYPAHVDPADTAAALARQVARLSRLTENLLALSRLEAGGGPGDRGVVDLGEVVGQAVRDHAGRVPMEVRIGPAPVRGDATDLGRAVTNLLANADRHAAGVVTVTVAPVDGGGRPPTEVDVVVANDGPTIPEDQLERIFDRLHRLDEARGLDAGGSGLGLAITRRIADGHGGWVRAENTGSGVAFRIRLPLWTPAAVGPPPSVGPAA